MSKPIETEVNSSQLAGLDVGERRIGVALARPVAALARPFTTLLNDETIWEQLERLIAREHISGFVVGLPRGLDGQETAQTAVTRTFADQLRTKFKLPVHLQDEAGTSVQAEDELRAGGKGYNKAMIDAQAAAIILQDFLNMPAERTT